MNAAKKLDPPTDKCLICETQSKKLRRGLCAMHSARFKRALKLVPADMVEAFEAKLIAEGKLLPKRQGGKLTADQDEFLAAVEELVEHPQTLAIEHHEPDGKAPPKKNRGGGEKEGMSGKRRSGG